MYLGISGHPIETIEREAGKCVQIGTFCTARNQLQWLHESESIERTKPYCERRSIAARLMLASNSIAEIEASTNITRKRHRAEGKAVEALRRSML